MNEALQFAALILILAWLAWSVLSLIMLAGIKKGLSKGRSERED